MLLHRTMDETITHAVDSAVTSGPALGAVGRRLLLLITAHPNGLEWGPTQGPPPVVHAKPLDDGRLVALRPLA